LDGEHVELRVHQDTGEILVVNGPLAVDIIDPEGVRVIDTWAYRAWVVVVRNEQQRVGRPFVSGLSIVVM
jgi:hypothetical protein